MRMVEEESSQRITLAANLHGEVAGSLVACASMGEIIRLTLEQDVNSTRATELLTQLDSSVRQALQVIRILTESQFPSVLKVFGLNLTLQQHVSEAAKNDSVSIVLHTTGEELPFDFHRKLNLFQIVQTLITRLASNNKTSSIEITSRTENDWLEITIDHLAFDDPLIGEDAAIEMEIIQARCKAYDFDFRILNAELDRGVRYTLTAHHSLAPENEIKGEPRP